MDRLRAWTSRSISYRQLDPSIDDDLGARPEANGAHRDEYCIFMLLGLATLWPFNMYLNAGPYLNQRFAADPWTRDNFQAAEISVSSIVNLVTMIVFTRRQTNASYPKRITVALIIYFVTFILLAASTKALLDVSVSTYFAFLIVTVLITSFGTGLIQNGSFSYVSSYGQPVYMQSMMVGQAIAGVLPSVVQIILALSLQTDDARSNADSDGIAREPRSSDALAFFLTASAVAVITLAASFHLFVNRPPPSLIAQKPARAGSPDSHTVMHPSETAVRRPVSFLMLAQKLRHVATAVVICFAVTMASFPVYTQEITSVNPTASRFTQPNVFIPLSFLFWNSGDLLGRITTAWPWLIPHQKPRLVLALSIARAVLIPIYNLCNVRGRGAAVPSDTFYFAFQLTFGFTNGYVGSLCMMSAGDHVEPEEAEAAGSFMGICLILGLGVGSLLSFAFTGT